MARQWWPDKRPAGTGPWPERPSDDAGDSGSISTVANTAITNQRLCAKTFPKQSDVVLEVTSILAGNSASTNASPSWDLCSSNPVAGSGRLLVEYGSGGAFERVLMDLRAGSYQLPPCEEVRVTVSTTLGSVAMPALNIGGALAVGKLPSPTLPTYTWALALNLDDSVSVPSRARFVDLWLANETTTNKYGAGAPVLSLLGDGAQAQLIRDYTTGIWAPPFPSPLITAGGLDGTYQRQLFVATTVACVAVVQFGLEL